MIEIAIGLGMVLSLLFSEMLGVVAGGIVVPGYIALNLNHPERVTGTFLVAWLVFLIITILSRFMFIYGKRRLVLALLLGFLLGFVSRQYAIWDWIGTDTKLYAIGYIIPGLIANWMIRQGVLRTIASVLIVSVLVGYVLMFLTGGKIG